MDDRINPDDMLNLINAYETLRTKLQQKFESTPGIRKIIEFRVLNSPMYLFPGQNTLLHDSLGEEIDEIEWIKRVLTVEKIYGEFYLMYNGWDSGEQPDVQRPWVKVDLSPQFEWVEPLWKIGEALYFIPADTSYFFEVISDEGIPRAFKKK
jgi:hypothetical protein